MRTRTSKIEATMAHINPAIAPSQVFPGLMVGTNLCLPIAVPKNKAPESVANVTKVA